ncbi:hypothetical protein C8R44DRAFT_822277, partial [Mycena epipterygia]
MQRGRARAQNEVPKTVQSGLMSTQQGISDREICGAGYRPKARDHFTAQNERKAMQAKRVPPTIGRLSERMTLRRRSDAPRDSVGANALQIIITNNGGVRYGLGGMHPTYTFVGTLSASAARSSSFHRGAEVTRPWKMQMTLRVIPSTPVSTPMLCKELAKARRDWCGGRNHTSHAEVNRELSSRAQGLARSTWRVSGPRNRCGVHTQGLAV